MNEIIESPWQNKFQTLIKEAKNCVYLASPFIKQQTALIVSENLNPNTDFRFLNSFKLAHFHSGFSDLEALKTFANKHCRQKNIPNLHAKLYVFDNKAVITSGNLTPGGLSHNLEIGVLITSSLVDKIKSYYLEIFNNSEYPEITDNIIAKMGDILDSIPKEKRKKLTIDDNELFADTEREENIQDIYNGGIPSIQTNLHGWEKDVFQCLLSISNNLFTLQEVYSFENKLSQLHPDNMHVKAKIRQQLQYLRDLGLLEFTSPGRYKKLWTG